jgi:archaemetzincin
MNNVEIKVINQIRTSLQANYLCEVQIAKPCSLPPHSFIHLKTPRYRADSLLKYLKKIKPSNTNLILGITSEDISTTKLDADGNIKKPIEKYKDFGVFGLGYQPGSSCIISTFRLGNDPNIIRNRIAKIAVHEIGHNLGLSHCKNINCVMQDAVESILTIDRESNSLCTACAGLIQGTYSDSVE